MNHRDEAAKAVAINWARSHGQDPFAVTNTGKEIWEAYLPEVYRGFVLVEARLGVSSTDDIHEALSLLLKRIADAKNALQTIS